MELRDIPGYFQLFSNYFAVIPNNLYFHLTNSNYFHKQKKREEERKKEDSRHIFWYLKKSELAALCSEKLREEKGRTRKEKGRAAGI